MADYLCRYCGRTESFQDWNEVPHCMHRRHLLFRRNGMDRVKHQTYPVVIVPRELVDAIESIFTEEQS